jgi:hypothetical protein
LTFKNVFKATAKFTTTMFLTLAWLWSIACSLQLLTESSDLLLVAGLFLACAVSGAYVWIMSLLWRKKTNENKTV